MRKQLVAPAIMVLIFSFVAAAQVADTNLGLQATQSTQQITFVNQDPDPAEPGGYVDVRFKLENVGSETTKAAIFEILMSYPFSLEPGDSAQKQLGTIDAGQVGDKAYVIRYRLRVDKNAVQGNNELRVRYSENNGETWKTFGPFEVNVRSINPILSIEAVTSDPEMVAPGDTIKVDIKLKNNAASFFKNVKATLMLVKLLQTATSLSYTELPFSPLGSTNEKTVLSIDAGQTADIEFQLVADPDTKAGVYKVPIVVSYSDELGKNFSLSNVFSLMVGEQPDVAVNIDSSTLYKAQTSGKVSIKFINKGSSDIKFVYLQLKKSNDYDIVSPETVYLGNINSDDYASADFDLYLNKGVKEKVILSVLAEFRDTNNKKYTQDYNLELKLYSQEVAETLGLSKGSSSVGILVSVLIVVAGLTGYWFYRRRAKK